MKTEKKKSQWSLLVMLLLACFSAELTTVFLVQWTGSQTDQIKVIWPLFFLSLSLGFVIGRLTGRVVFLLWVGLMIMTGIAFGTFLSGILPFFLEFALIACIAPYGIFGAVWGGRYYSYDSFFQETGREK